MNRLASLGVVCLVLVSAAGAWAQYSGPPTIADVDGDGEPEIGVAGGSFYAVFETDGRLSFINSPVTLTFVAPSPAAAPAPAKQESAEQPTPTAKPAAKKSAQPAAKSGGGSGGGGGGSIRVDINGNGISALSGCNRMPSR